MSADLAITPAESVVVPVKNEARNLPMVLSSASAWVNEAVLVAGADDAKGSRFTTSGGSDDITPARQRPTRSTTFQQVVQGSNIQQILVRDRALTKGWAMVGPARAALGSNSRGR